MTLLIVLMVLAEVFLLVAMGVEWTNRQLKETGPCCPDGRCRGNRG